MRRALVGTLLISLAGVWLWGGIVSERLSVVTAQTGTPTVTESRITTRADFLPSLAGTDPVFILAIGSDARPGYCEPVERCLADSLHLIAINPRERAATVLGIPRDSYVNVPGLGLAKINESLHAGGPSLVVDTVQQLTGVAIDSYFLTSFEGFRKMVNSVGGLDVEIPYPIGAEDDLQAFAPGVQELDGEEALDLARNRKGVPNGDFSRSENQGRILIAALEKFRESVQQDPFTLLTWVASGVAYINTDVSPAEIFRLALAALSISPTKVVNVVVPGGIETTPEGASIVTLGEEAQMVFEDIRDDALVIPSE